MGPAIWCEGEEHVEAAWEADSHTKRANLARKALEKDLDNIDAYILLSHTAKTQGEALALLREAVRVGDRLWAPLLDDPEMHWWGFVGTRPYLRALHELGLALEAAGDDEEAEEIWRRLLRLNPNDNQGVRGLLIRRLMDKPRVGELRALLADYPEDDMIESVMARLWLALRSKSADMARLGPEIDARNRYVLAQIAGRGRPASKIERSPYGITLGGEDEALSYAEEFADIWSKSPGHLAKLDAWLDAGAPR